MSPSNILMEIATKLSGMGGVVTGSFVLYLLKIWNNPGDVDVIFLSTKKDAILMRLERHGFTYNDGSLFRDGKKVADLIFVPKLPNKQRVVAGITCIDSDILIRIYKENLDNKERKDKRASDSEKIKSIRKYQEEHSSLSPGNKENQSFPLNSVSKRKRRRSSLSLSPIPISWNLESKIDSSNSTSRGDGGNPMRRLFF